MLSLCFLLGTVLGAALLFASPSYRAAMGEGASYQMELTLAGLFARAKENCDTVQRFFLADCPLLYLPLTLLALAHFVRGRKRWFDWPLAAVLLGGCGYFVGRARNILPENVSWIAVVLWTLALALACLSWLRGAARSKALFFGALAVAAAVPMLFVSPIGPRCLFASYAFLMLVALTLLHELAGDYAEHAALFGIAAALAVFVFYAHTYAPLHAVDEVRLSEIERAMAAGEHEVLLPAYPEGGWLWDGDNAGKMEAYYFYERSGDLAIDFLPYEEWPFAK